MRHYTSWLVWALLVVSASAQKTTEVPDPDSVTLHVTGMVKSKSGAT